MRCTLSLVLLAALVCALSACSDGDAVDCDRLADHKFALTISAMPKDMQARAKKQFSSKRNLIEETCERERPSSEVASCQLEATSLHAFEQCARR